MATLLEVCVDSYASAMAAVRGGADRLELCSALAVGGLTPSAALLRQIRRVSSIPIRCLMRPRGGDFLYTPEGIEQMAMEIRELHLAGADGFVIGCLTADGSLDREAMKPLLEAASGAGLTLHRCIDVSRDPVQTYRDAAEMGIDTVLTSGAAGNCVAGMETIRTLLTLREEAQGPEVLIGAGVSAKVIERFRREGVPMGLPGLDEWHIQQTDEAAIQAAREILDSLC